jgi:hypothetical protein
VRYCRAVVPRVGKGWVSVDPVTIGAVLLAVVSGTGGQLGAQLWQGVVSLVRRPFYRQGTAGGDRVTVEAVPTGESELAALQQTRGDQSRAVALAAALLARARVDEEFGRALESWWDQAGPVRASIGNATNTISGGTQRGPVLQGRDFSGITLSAGPAVPPVPPS